MFSNCDARSGIGAQSSSKPNSAKEATAALENGLAHEAYGATKQAIKVSVVIVTYSSKNELPACMDGVLKQRLPLEVFLVDNASPDNTAEMVTRYAESCDKVHAVLSPENVGLAAGNNLPRKRCQGDYILILNPDTVFRDNSLERMVDFLDRNPDVGVVGPRNVYPDGSAHVSYGRVWGLREVLIWRVLPYRIPRLLHDRMSKYAQEDVLFVSGSCLLIRRRIFDEIGGYDPEYFLCIEDVCDLCLRVRKTANRVVFLADAEVVHITGRSCVQAPYIVVWQGIRGAIYHFLKHKGLFQAYVVSILLGAAAVGRVAVAGVLGLGSKKYRNVARIYSTVIRDLILRNPIRINRSAAQPSSGRKEYAQQS